MRHVDPNLMGPPRVQGAMHQASMVGAPQTMQGGVGGFAFLNSDDAVLTDLGERFRHHLADDFVIGCEREDDARRILAVLPKRFARFKLTIHPQKTRLVHFQPAGGILAVRP